MICKIESSDESVVLVLTVANVLNTVIFGVVYINNIILIILIIVIYNLHYIYINMYIYYNICF